MLQKENAIENLLQLKAQSKFDADDSTLYPGIGYPEIKDSMTNIVNEIINNFIILVNKNGTEENFWQAISEGLSCFSVFKVKLDTEDRECICNYFEQMMDAIGLESSNGILNRWLYGFDIKM